MKTRAGRVLLVAAALLTTTGAFAADLGAVAQLGQEMLTVHRGQTVSMDLRNADVRTVLQMLAEVGRMNIVVAEGVSGSITLKVKNVHWRTAMNLVLKTKGLDVEKDGTVLYVDKADAIAEARMQRVSCESIELGHNEFCFRK